MTTQHSDQPRPNAAGSASLDEACTPKDLKVKIAEQRLLVDWMDGSTGELPFAALRRHCPCAACRGEREKKQNNPLNILPADPSTLRVVNAELVGTYAIQFHWSDGHKEGIFDFRLLRRLVDGM